MRYGKSYVEALEETVILLLSTEGDVEGLAYSMMTEAVESNNWEAVRFYLTKARNVGSQSHGGYAVPLTIRPLCDQLVSGFERSSNCF